MFFFFEVPRKFQSPQRITSLGGFLAGESSKYFRARKVTLGHVEEVIEGNPTLWLCLKVTPYRGWYMGTGLAEKPWKSWKVEVKKHRPQWTHALCCMVGMLKMMEDMWEWETLHIFERVFMKSSSASSLSTFYVGTRMGGVQNARPNRDEWRSEEDF